ncbi:hypothetical protein VNO78_12067 [Psophocarpus tetragonolobus]|uniref:Uncharacterized protein n=1 Tax=Psophocarpus tetragonolobus TaxID=3891 RepID=A0AAN9SQ96_PSOTE
MDSDHNPLHIFFFPFLAHGHIIPIVDMAKLFAAKGIKATIITTPLNVPLISKAIGIQKTETCFNKIHVHPIKFPSVKVGLPEGCENVDSLPSPQSFPIFFKATRVLQQPLEQLLLEQHPDCLIADPFHTWVTDSAAKLGIPRIVFQGVSVFTLCSLDCIKLYEPHHRVSSDSEYFVINNLPVNSFYELEQVYADYYKDVLKRKAWHIGPMFLSNAKEKAERGNEVCLDESEWLKWLDTKETNSVVYVCFGTLTNFPDSQLREIAMGLEASGNQFMWVHQAIGAFVTRCGWNSILEAVTAWVPMVTMPVAAEQFFNEKLVTEVLKIGVSVGGRKWVRLVGDSTKWDELEEAVKRIMTGEEDIEMRNRAKVLSQIAMQAVQEGGSSYSQFSVIEIWSQIFVQGVLTRNSSTLS